jgi:hypothetical protein
MDIWVAGLFLFRTSFNISFTYSKKVIASHFLLLLRLSVNIYFSTPTILILSRLILSRLILSLASENTVSVSYYSVSSYEIQHNNF